MSENSKQEEFYKKLKEKLEDTTNWPSEYLYKFIVPTQQDKIVKIEDIFDNMGAVINTIKSSNGNYTSISVNLKMESPDAVIEKYKEVGEKVPDVISL
ncbi:DUF493 family protein [Mesonia sp. K7]|uniref:DUF493 family protein n=1 Tax=Mesonia sp. K7 TaxID=2218606 RepID=UPI000DA87EA1|nr:DUF493 family protein [Mesonia sp. K7]PZD78216.1 DUF493 domain-containing protein [Mesonia sp. K7]